MPRVANALSIALAVFLVVTAVPAGAQEEEDAGDPGLLQLRPEMRDGTWFGSGIAAGIADLNVEQIQLLSDLEVYGNFYFDVRQGEVTGTWDIVAPSAGTIEMTYRGALATLDATYTGSGEVTGDRTRVKADAVVTQDGTVRMSGGQTVTADNTEELPSKIAAEVTTAFCNEVYGDWAFSWEQTLQSVGWNPSFHGEWVAVRQSAEFEEQIDEDSQVQELTTDIAEAASRWRGSLLPQFESRDHSLPYSDTEWDSIIRLIEEFESIQNRLRNLTPCDKELFGDDQVENWLHLMERGVLAIIEGAAAAGELAGWEVEMLTGIGIRTGGLSEVSSDPHFAEDVSELLQQQAERTVNEYYEWSEDEKHFEIPRGTDFDDLSWAIKAGEKMAWHFTLEEGGHARTVAASNMWQR